VGRRDLTDERDDVGDVPGAAALDPQPATWAQEPEGGAQDRRPVGGGHPLEDGAGEDGVERSVLGQRAVEVLGTRLDEALVRRGGSAGDLEQGGLRVDADDLAVGHEGRHGRREVPGATADVEHPVGGPHREARQEGGIVGPVVTGVGGVELAVPRRQRSTGLQGCLNI
jgi:hypothetical protein